MTFKNSGHWGPRQYVAHKVNFLSVNFPPPRGPHLFAIGSNDGPLANGAGRASRRGDDCKWHPGAKGPKHNTEWSNWLRMLVLACLLCLKVANSSMLWRVFFKKLATFFQPTPFCRLSQSRRSLRSRQGAGDCAPGISNISQIFYTQSNWHPLDACKMVSNLSSLLLAPHVSQSLSARGLEDYFFYSCQMNLIPMVNLGHWLHPQICMLINSHAWQIIWSIFIWYSIAKHLQNVNLVALYLLQSPHNLQSTHEPAGRRWLQTSVCNRSRIQGRNVKTPSIVSILTYSNSEYIYIYLIWSAAPVLYVYAIWQ